ncbi:MAG: OmpA family protein [Alphaproteobacteria bacterium]|nr:OmpA family protein [Alphaproteobacteria bacterium]
MKSVRNLVLAAGVLALGGCTMYDTYSEVEALNEAQPVGSPFTQALAGEYKTFANERLDKMMDYPDALHFARKGLAAAAGEAVMPEPVTDWNLSEKHIREMAAARGRLVITFDLGGREIAPSTAALAQAKYDCWIESQEEHWLDEGLVDCKSDFMNTVAELEGLVQQTPPPPPEPIEPPPMVPEEAMYLVFFNWDSADLSSGAKNVLDAIAQEVAKNPPTQVVVDGHADTSGSKEYNKRLAFKRANAVRDALTQRGINESLMVVDSSGEEELLVETLDNVREPANRRVNISFR